MRLITDKTVKSYMQDHPDAAGSLKIWTEKVKLADWNDFHDMRETFNSVDSVGNDNYVFNIRGNSYRLIARVIFAGRKVYPRFFGSHAEYDKIEDCSQV